MNINEIVAVIEELLVRVSALEKSTAKLKSALEAIENNAQDASGE